MRNWKKNRRIEESNDEEMKRKIPYRKANQIKVKQIGPTNANGESIREMFQIEWIEKSKQIKKPNQSNAIEEWEQFGIQNGNLINMQMCCFSNLWCIT